MNEVNRIALEMALEGFKADLVRIEKLRGELTQSDRAELQIVMARLNSVLSRRQAA